MSMLWKIPEARIKAIILMFILERRVMNRVEMVMLKLSGVAFSLEIIFPALLKQTVLFHHAESNRKF